MVHFPVAGFGESQSQASLSRSSNGGPVARAWVPAPGSACAAAQLHSLPAWPSSHGGASSAFFHSPVSLPSPPSAHHTPRVRLCYSWSNLVWALQGIITPYRALATSMGVVQHCGLWEELVWEGASGSCWVFDLMPIPHFPHLNNYSTSNVL